MMKTLNAIVTLSFILSFATVTPVQAEDVAVSPDESSEESSKELTCEKIKWGETSVAVVDAEGNIQLQLSKDKEIVDKLDPEVDGPDSKCLQIKDFEKEQSLVVEICRGFTGTKALVERHALLLVRVVDGKFKLIDTIELKHSEVESNVTTVKLDLTYKVKRRDDKIVVITKERKSKKETETVF